jgi:hypothetical protein
VPARRVGLLAASRLRIWAPDPTQVHFAILCLATALLVFFAQCVQVSLWSVRTPLGDQWDAEWDRLLRPYLSGQFDWSLLFAPHNEHRIFWTRLTSLVLYHVNGSWNPRAEMVVSAVLNGTVAALLVFATRGFPTSVQRFLSIWFVVLLSWPSQWENFLRGFQNAMFFTTALTTATLYMVARMREVRLRDFFFLIPLGVACTLTTASGLLVWLAISVLAALEAAQRLRSASFLRPAALSAVCMAAFIAAYLSTPQVPGHMELRSPNLVTWWSAFTSALTYPFGQPSLPLAVWSVLPALVAIPFARHALVSTTARFGIALVGVAVASCAAFAQSRGGFDLVPSSRYVSSLQTHIIGGLIILFWLQDRLPRAALPKTLLNLTRALTVIWASSVALGLFSRLEKDVHAAQTHAQVLASQQTRLLEILATPDISRLVTTQRSELPYPDGRLLLRWLEDPKIHSVLPPPLRLRESPRWRNASGDAWAQDATYPSTPPRERVWGSYIRGRGNTPTGSSESQVLLATRPYLSITYSGYPAHMQRPLVLRGTRDQSIDLQSNPGEKWQPSVVYAGQQQSEQLVLVLNDSSNDWWWAVSDIHFISGGELAFDAVLAFALQGLLLSALLWWLALPNWLDFGLRL